MMECICEVLAGGKGGKLGKDIKIDIKNSFSRGGVM